MEVAIEDSKQVFSAGQARNRTARAVERAIPFQLACQAIAVTWNATAGHDPADVQDHRARAPWDTTKARPSTADMAAKLRRVPEAVAREQTVLVDGFLAPTWSWRDTPELWSGKHKTTGFNGQAISNLRGDLLFVSEPVTGNNHDMTALAETETADVMAAAFSGIGDKGYQGSGFITPFKKPQGGKLLDWQKEFNAEVNRLRAQSSARSLISNPGVFSTPITGGHSAHT